MRIPTFSRQPEPTDNAQTADQAAVGSAGTPVRPRRDAEATTATDLPPQPRHTDRDLPPANRSDLPPAPPRPTEAQRAAALDRPDNEPATTATPVVEGPKPRASLLATLSLILGVASVMLVLSGQLLGYGIGVAGLALILSLAGVHATGKRHVAGKTDALIGMVLSLGAIVLGVLALTGSLSWLGTDTQPVNSLREWLDTQFVNRF